MLRRLFALWERSLDERRLAREAAAARYDEALAGLIDARTTLIEQIATERSLAVEAHRSAQAISAAAAAQAETIKAYFDAMASQAAMYQESMKQQPDLAEAVQQDWTTNPYGTLFDDDGPPDG